MGSVPTMLGTVAPVAAVVVGGSAGALTGVLVFTGAGAVVGAAVGLAVGFTVGAGVGFTVGFGVGVTVPPLATLVTVVTTGAQPAARPRPTAAASTERRPVAELG